MLLRSDDPRRRLVGAALLLLVGAGAAALVALGNPGNMGICGACFLRDLAGSVGLSPGPAILRPEIVGMALGATLLALVRRSFVGRSGSHATTRFLLGGLMAVGALVFLGCPFRMLQRLGGGDPNAWMALPGFVAGVGVGLAFERRGYSVGRTSPVPAPVGLVGPLVLAGLLAAFLLGVLKGPGPGGTTGPAHARWEWALAIGLGAGVLLSLTGFCAVSAARQVFRGPRGILLAAAAFVLGYLAVAFATGKFGASPPPIAHADLLWNLLGLGLVGLCGALAGGCPVRQVVMAGEGNGDAFVTCAGIAIGGALAHGFGWVSAPATATAAGGPTAAGRTAVVVGLAFAVLYGLAMTRRREAAAPAAAPTEV